MIHRSDSKNRAAAGVLKDKGMKKPECSQAKGWGGPDGPMAHGQGGSCGEGSARVTGSPVREQARGKAWSWEAWWPGVQTQAVGPSTANSGGNGKSK